MRTKNKQINFRVTEKQFEKINQNAEILGLNVSEFLLTCALEKRITLIPDFDKASYELNKVGVNLNQITKLCNEGKIASTDLSETKKEVEKIWQLLNSLTQKIV